MKNKIDNDLNDYWSRSELKAISRDKWFHLWQLANDPKFKKSWGWMTHQNKFIDEVNAYDETASDADDQFKKLVSLAEVLLIEFNQIEK